MEEDNLMLNSWFYTHMHLHTRTCTRTHGEYWLGILKDFLQFRFALCFSFYIFTF